MKKINLYEVLLKIFILVMGIIAIYMLLLKIFGYSPTIDQIILIVVTIGAGVSINTHFRFAHFKGKVEEFMHVTKNTFRKMHTEMKEMRSEFNTEIKEIRSDLEQMKRDIFELKRDMAVIKAKIS